MSVLNSMNFLIMIPLNNVYDKMCGIGPKFGGFFYSNTSVCMEGKPSFKGLFLNPSVTFGYTIDMWNKIFENA